ncbi:MAG: 3-methyl-2-oxobutanoate dehydrogenase subunit beta [Desulfobacterales bacterium]|nr:MAG: 3-methyl-2-oxobutanoate dehydrogenase subunit beta [Desulfobacterales bacterium]
MIQLNIPHEEYMYSGHVACPGCGASIAMKFALKALGEKTMVVIPACCWGVIAGPYPQTSLKVPILQTAFATAGATASGLRAALDIKGDRETTVMAWAGDGGTFDIGIQALSGAAERNEDFIYVCYDNEAYMNTGVQRSSATPFGTQTTTTPGQEWKKSRKKNIIEILSAHRIPYAATANIAFPEDMIQKFRKAKQMKGGTRFLHVFASCPTGWRMPSEMSVKISRLAVQSNVFPLYEVENGVDFTLNAKGNRPVTDYLNVQGRFKHLTGDDITRIQNMVDEDWERLMCKIDQGAGIGDQG